MRTIHAATLAVAAVLLSGCFSNSESEGGRDPGPVNPASGNNVPPSPPPATFRALFQPGQGILPYPTDLLLNGSSDGTINGPSLAVQPNGVSVNALDGFSTTADITVRFSSAVDAASAAAQGSIVLLESRVATIATTTTIARVPIPVGVRRLTPDVDYSVSLSTAADAAGSVVVIRPLRPLTPSTGGVAPAGTLPAGLPPGTIDIGGTGYTVLVTTGVRSSGGTAVAPDSDYAALRQVIGTPPNPANCAAITDATTNGLCQQVAPQLGLAAQAGVAPSTVALSFSFTTVATRDTLARLAQGVQAAATPPALALQPLPRPGGGVLTTKNVLDPQGTNAAIVGNANVHAGTITLPYYLPTNQEPNVGGQPAPLVGQFQSAAPFSLLPGTNCAPAAPATPPAACTRFVTRYNPVPAPVRNVTIPVLLAIPNAATKPANGWPMVVFLHGLGGNRSNALAIAESYAQAGFATIAIDQPLHGITPTDSAAALRIPGVTERTFDADYVNNTTRVAPGGDGPDPSGASFIQVASPITSRDNLRQSAIDVITLATSLRNAVVVGQAAPVFDPQRIHFAGQSLGGIVGTLIAGVASDFQSAALSVPGGGIARLLLDSPTFGPGIIQAVAANLGANTLLFNAFFRDAQAAVDAGDPLNYAATARTSQRLLLQKVIGDTVVPNSSTDRLIAAAGLTKATGAGAWPEDTFVTLTRGSHGSLLLPAPAGTEAVTAEMRRQFVTFVASGGTGYQIVDATSVEP
ncbi:MAG: hypothetical protein O9284_19000 [Steroidobacteraceae bacterium]|nr:hypothetical protein [Steroidobacteraceae bacterium]